MAKKTVCFSDCKGEILRKARREDDNNTQPDARMAELIASQPSGLSDIKPAATRHTKDPLFKTIRIYISNEELEEYGVTQPSTIRLMRAIKGRWPPYQVI